MEEFIERLTRNLLNALDLKKLTKDDLSNLKKGDEFYHTDKFESNELHKCKIVSVSKSKIRYEVGNGVNKEIHLTGFNSEDEKVILGKYKLKFFSKNEPS
jgi:hypothetical protein